MKNGKLIGMLSIPVAALALALALGTAAAQVTKGKSRLMATKHLMRGLMNVHCGGIKKGLEAGPSKDKDWEELETHAALINEASYVLMDDGRCPDATWAEAASKTLRQGSAEVLKAVGAKDLEGAKKAFESMTGGCAACHKAHRKSQ